MKVAYANSLCQTVPHWMEVQNTTEQTVAYVVTRQMWLLSLMVLLFVNLKQRLVPFATVFIIFVRNFQYQRVLLRRRLLLHLFLQS